MASPIDFDSRWRLSGGAACSHLRLQPGRSYLPTRSRAALEPSGSSSSSTSATGGSQARCSSPTWQPSRGSWGLSDTEVVTTHEPEPRSGPVVRPGRPPPRRDDAAGPRHPLGADGRVTDSVKWKTPTFAHNGYIASFNPSKHVLSITLHRGAEIPGEHPRRTESHYSEVRQWPHALPLRTRVEDCPCWSNCSHSRPQRFAECSSCTCSVGGSGVEEWRPRFQHLLEVA